MLASTSNYISKLVIRYEQKLIELGTGILTTTKGPGHNSTLSDFIKMQVPNNMLSVSQKPQKKNNNGTLKFSLLKFLSLQSCLRYWCNTEEELRSLMIPEQCQYLLFEELSGST